MAETRMIADYTELLFEKYERLKAGDRSVPFWDLVVVCCSAAARTEAACRRCLAALRLPACAEYRVAPDPPGPKVECGGATMHLLQALQEEFGPRLKEMRAMLIHCGGFSSRLVQHAVLGKLFSVLPLPGGGLTVLELKLVMYLPYAALLPPGVLVTGCDDIQLAWLPQQTPADLFTAEDQNFVALSHPAPISVAVNHGVYVLPPSERRGNASLYTAPCEEVLQKPSQQLIRERGGVIVTDGEERVQIDGAFWLGPAAQSRLRSLYARLRPLTEEVSAYRDWLPCLGRRRPTHYETELLPRLPAGSARAEMFELREAGLRVLAVPRSRFYHLGTVPEYLEHLCGGGELAEVLRLDRRCGSVGPSQKGVVINSVLGKDVSVAADALVEFCLLEGEVTVGAGSLLSHCHVAGPCHVPAHVLLHTAAVTWRGQRRHVAILTGVADDVKSAPARLFGHEVEGADGNLWTARLFSAEDTMAEAVAASLRRLAGPQYRAEPQLWSMADVMQYRDPEAMLDFREKLRQLVETEVAGAGDRR